MFSKERKQSYIGLGGCVLLFFLGEFLLNTLSAQEDPPGGQTLYIIAGVGLIVASVAGIFLIIRRLRNLKRKERRKKKSRVAFLDKNGETRRRSSEKLKS